MQAAIWATCLTGAKRSRRAMRTVVQRGRDRERRQGADENVAVAFLRQQPGLQDRLGQFLDEQRHAIGPGQDLREHFCGQRLAARELLDHGCALPAPEAAQGQQRDMRRGQSNAGRTRAGR